MHLVDYKLNISDYIDYKASTYFGTHHGNDVQVYKFLFEPVDNQNQFQHITTSSSGYVDAYDTVMHKHEFKREIFVRSL